MQGIGANWAVALAVWSANSIHDVAGKILAMWAPIFAFATIGFEHCIANTATLSVGWLFGAENVSFFAVCYNLFYCSLGNMIGSGILFGWFQIQFFFFDSIYQNLNLFFKI